ncbi:MAG: GNAT family N-acetyltransferase [Hyphomonadaceae bacterium]
MKLSPCDTEGRFARLFPICEAHREGLRAAAADPAIWRHWPRPVAALGWDVTFDRQLVEQAEGGWMLHTVFAPDGAAVGQTCYLAIEPAHARVEIGGTWYAPAAQGGPINPQCKLLMLRHAFACGAERVELKTDAENTRSRAAILKLGAQFEGIFRHHMRRPDGSWRDTAWFSILRSEWPAVRSRLETRLRAFA